MNEDERYMKRAIELGWLAIGRTSPNPLVGCVIVRDGVIVGEGFHVFSKITHAEIIALTQAGEKSNGATLYVSVEPCCHTGRTPPCTVSLIDAGISRVVYGMKDPDPRVNGGGHKILSEAGIEVLGGIFEDEIREQNKFFVTVHEKGRPHVLLKWAMTLDGKIATRTGFSRWISNESSRNIVHHLRNIYDAILVGHGTILTDNPKLDCRVDPAFPLPENIFPATPVDIRNPKRIIIDALSATFINGEYQVFQQEGKTLVAVAEESVWDDTRVRDSVDSETIELVECPLTGGHIDLGYLLNVLKDRGISSILVEGGGGIHAAFLEAGLVDEIAIFVSPKIFGGDLAASPVEGTGVEMICDCWQLENIQHLRIEDDLLITGAVDFTQAEKEDGVA